MDDGNWLDNCHKRGLLNETNIKQWSNARTEQIRVSF